MNEHEAAILSLLLSVMHKTHTEKANSKRKRDGEESIGRYGEKGSTPLKCHFIEKGSVHCHSCIIWSVKCHSQCGLTRSYTHTHTEVWLPEALHVSFYISTRVDLSMTSLEMDGLMRNKNNNGWTILEYMIYRKYIWGFIWTPTGMFVAKANKWMWSGAKAQICSSSCSSWELPLPPHAWPVGFPRLTDRCWTHTHS